MEECFLCLLCRYPLLYVVHYQHVDGLIEVDEVVHGVVSHGIGVLHLEESGTDIQHSLLRIELLGAHSDGVDEVRFAASRRSVDEHRVELCGIRMLGDRLSHGSRQLVARSFDIVAEGEVGVELRCYLLWLGSVERCRRLVVACLLRLLVVDSGWRVGSEYLCKIVRLVGNDAIRKLDIFAESACKHLSQQINEVLFQVFVNEWTRNLHQQSVRLLLVSLEHYWLEPCIELLR